MNKIIHYLFIGFCCCAKILGQHKITMDVVLVDSIQSLQINQTIKYINQSNTVLNEIYFTDWANSFSSKTTPLAIRFGENFNASFHFEKDENRGKTIIESITNFNKLPLAWQRGKEADIIRVPLDNALLPGDSVQINFNYNVKIAEDKFTRYGVSKDKQYKLKYWYIAPAVYNYGWQAYSHKNTDDYYQPPSHFKINFHYPKPYQLFSELNETSRVDLGHKTIVRLEGKNRVEIPIYLDKFNQFKSVVTDLFEVVTDMKDKKVTPNKKALLIDRITRFLNQKIGPYPFEKLLVSDADYRNNPVYGLNQLPDFLSPFPSGFETDMELLKTISRRYLENTILINPREDYWLIGALQIYLLTEYINTYYTDIKIMGSFSDFIVIRWSHASELEFNDQYPFLYLNMARSNLHQSLATPKDSLIKFNKNIANDYYAGAGFQYLKDYLGQQNLENAIQQFYSKNKLIPTQPSTFQEILESNTTLPVNWFFDEYVDKRTVIDFKIKKVEDYGDSLKVTIKNKRPNIMPVSIYGINKDSIIFKKWSAPIDSLQTVIVPKKGVKKLVLNYESVIPEYNKRNNYKTLSGLLNRPLQFRLLKDVEDPNYNQVFLMPVVEFNLYDGLSIGPKLYNKTFLPKGIHYKIEPQYGFTSQTLIGKASIVYNDLKNGTDLYSVRYGISGNIFSYNTDLFYRRLSPYITLAFRDHEDLRKNKKQFLNFRSVILSRDLDPNNPEQEPNYSVYNARYVYTDNNLIDFYRGEFDFQIAKRFSKIATELEYRKLFLSNRQLNVRFFAGLFLYNKTPRNDDFFSFALDRPTDYLFDYNYYGRSEEAGLFSQQLIIAEGGFKSQLEPAFSNSWLMTLNTSTNIWKWIFAYADVGLVKNTGFNAKPVFNTGIRASLVADYFEIYFPLYSNLGWEPGLDRYDQRIRFIVTLDIRTLLGLFTREWY